MYAASEVSAMIFAGRCLKRGEGFAAVSAENAVHHAELALHANRGRLIHRLLPGDFRFALLRTRSPSRPARLHFPAGETVSQVQPVLEEASARWGHRQAAAAHPIAPAPNPSNCKPGPTGERKRDPRNRHAGQTLIQWWDLRPRCPRYAHPRGFPSAEPIPLPSWWCW